MLTSLLPPEHHTAAVPHQPCLQAPGALEVSHSHVSPSCHLKLHLPADYTDIWLSAAILRAVMRPIVLSAAGDATLVDRLVFPKPLAACRIAVRERWGPRARSWQPDTGNLSCQAGNATGPGRNILQVCTQKGNRDKAHLLRYLTLLLSPKDSSLLRGFKAKIQTTARS